MFRAAVIALIVLALGLCCWAVVRDTNAPESEQSAAARRWRGTLRTYAGEVWGKQHFRLEGLTGPEGAMTLSLGLDEGHCTEPAIRLFILYTFGIIRPVETITCNEPGKSVSVEVRSYLEKIRATFPMIPDRPDTEVEFGGTVTEMSSHPSLYKQTDFKSRQELVDYLQTESPRAGQFASSSVLHKGGLQIYADPQDERILVVESVACDDYGYRLLCFSHDGLSKTTMVKWAELGGTFLVCKGERDMAITGMPAAIESLGLHPVNSVAECVTRKTTSQCN